MRISPADLAAYADGELEGEEAARVVLAIAADPELMRMAQRHRELRERLHAEFAPILQQEVPERLIALLRTGPEPDLAPRPEPEVQARVAAPSRNARTPRPTDHAQGAPHSQAQGPHKGRWIVGLALAALVALTFLLPRGGGPAYAEADLSNVLEQQIAATQDPNAATRILMSFRAPSGAYCRAFAAAQGGGVACRNSVGWRLVHRGESGGQAALLTRARSMAASPPLGPEAERAARAAGWQASR